MRQIFGKMDNHVPPEGRDLIRKTLHEKGVCFSFYEVAHAQRESPPPGLKPRENGYRHIITDAFKQMHSYGTN